MVEKSESIESDFKKVRECLLGSEEPAFVLVYDDSKKNLLQLISYVPENANVRRKMLYASSRAAFVRCVTLAKLDESYFASTPEELDYQQIMKSLSKQEDQSPLRQDELERKEYNEVGKLYWGGWIFHTSLPWLVEFIASTLLFASILTTM